MAHFALEQALRVADAVKAAIDEELARLPDRYRLPVLLCGGSRDPVVLYSVNTTASARSTSSCWRAVGATGRERWVSSRTVCQPSAPSPSTRVGAPSAACTTSADCYGECIKGVCAPETACQ